MTSFKIPDIFNNVGDFYFNHIPPSRILSNYSEVFNRTVMSTLSGECITSRVPVFL